MHKNVIIFRRPEDWTLSWGGSGSIFGWGHNHRGQLGGVEGAKVKLPTPCDTLTALRPIQLIGGEQTLFAVTADGKVRLLHTFFTCVGFRLYFFIFMCKHILEVAQYLGILKSLYSLICLFISLKQYKLLYFSIQVICH